VGTASRSSGTGKGYRHSFWRDRVRKRVRSVPPFLLAGHAYVGSPAFGAGGIGAYDSLSYYVIMFANWKINHQS